MFEKVIGSLKGVLSLNKKPFDTSMKGAMAAIAALGTANAALVAGIAATTAAGIGASVNAYASFEQTVMNAAAVSKEGAAAYDVLAEAALRASSGVEHTANDAGAALQYMGMAGMGVQESIKALPGVLDLATAGQIDLATATDATTNIMTGMGLTVADLARVNDVLVKTFISSNVNLQQLAKTFEYIGPVAKAFDQDIETIAALAGSLGNAGLQGEKGGTALRAMFVRLAKPMKTTKESMDALNVSLAKGPDEFHNMIDVIAQLEVAQQRLTKVEFAEHVARLFGSEALPAVNALLDQGSKKLKQFEQDLQNAGGTSEEVARNMRSTLNAQMKILKGEVNNAAIRLGQIFAPAVKVATEYLTGLTRSVLESRERFASLRDGVALVIRAAGHFVPAFAGVIKILIEVARYVDLVMTGFHALRVGLDALVLTQRANVAFMTGDVLGAVDLMKQAKAVTDSLEGIGKSSLETQKRLNAMSESVKSGADGLQTMIFRAAWEVEQLDLKQLNALASAAALEESMSGTGNEAGRAAKQVKDYSSALDALAATLAELDALESEALAALAALKQKTKESRLKEVEELGAKLAAEAEQRKKDAEELRGILASLDAAEAEIVLREHASTLKALAQDAFADVHAIFDVAQNAVSTMFSGGRDGAGGLMGGVLAGLQAAAENATSPAAALTAGLKALATSLIQAALQTEKGQAQLQSVGDALSGLFGDSFIVDLLGAFDGVLGVFHTIAAVFKPIEGFKGIFDKVGRVLFIYAKALGLQMMAFAEVFLVLKLVFISIPKIIIDAVVGLVDLLNKALAKIPGIGDDAIKADGLRAAQDKLTAAFQKSKDQVVDMAKGMKDLATLSYDEAKESAIRAQEEAKAVRNLQELNDQLRNAPSGFKLARARYGAADGGGGLGRMSARSGQADGETTVNIFGVSDPNEVLSLIYRKNYVRTGSRLVSGITASSAYGSVSLVGGG